MFYCDPCAKRLRWPETVCASFGPCEVCGRHTRCNNVPSSALPPYTALDGESAELHDQED